VRYKNYFGLIEKVKKDQPELAQILMKFPKGADLHNHLSGTVMPEDYISLGSANGDCFGPDSLVPAMYTITQATTPGVCASGFKPLMQANAEERQQLLRSLSMYQFNDKGITSIKDGHNQFFATFGRFGTVSGSPNNMGSILAKLRQQSNDENVSYVETMMSFQSAAVSSLADLLRQKYPDAAAYTQSSNYPAMFDYLLGAGLKDFVFAAQKDVYNYLNAVNAILKCGTAARTPPVRFHSIFRLQ